MNAKQDTLSFDDLLEHADWVRGLAYRLVQDAARADDLVQEAWVRALESPPRHTSNLRGWLGSVVTRLAQSEWRSERSRQVREQRGAREEALPPTDTLVQEAQLSSELVEAVTRMEEPYKTVLLLRFFRDRKPAQIAQELERPLATVKTQLQRGLDKLRRDFDDRYGDRRSWALAFLPLTRGGAPTLGAAGLSSGILTTLGGAAALAVMTFGVLWALESSTKPASNALEHAGTLAVELGPEDELEPFAAVERRVATQDSVKNQSSQPTAQEFTTAGPLVEADTRIEGLLLGLDGEPHVGAHVRWVDSGTLRWLDATQRVVTGPDTWVSISEPARARIEADDKAREAFARERFKRPDLALALLRGEPAPSFDTTTDSSGWFSFDVPQYSLSIELLDTELDVLGRSRTTTDNGDEVHTWFVAERRTLRGTAVDANGQPVGGAHIKASGEFPQVLMGKLAMGSGLASRQFETQSNAAGEFVFAGISIGRRVWISATTSELESTSYFVELSVEADIEPPACELVLVPNVESAPPLVLTGRVLLDDGTPAARATVVVHRQVAVADPNGEYRLALSSVEGDLCAARAGSGIAISAGLAERLRGASGEQRLADLVLPRKSLALEGHVLDESGAAVVGAQVDLYNNIDLPDGPNSLEDLAAGRYLTNIETDATGHFRIDGLADRDYELYITLGERRKRSRSYHAGDSNVQLSLPRVDED